MAMDVITLSLAKGYTDQHGGSAQPPEKGVDYWTAEDKAEIVADVLEALPEAIPDGDSAAY